MTPHMQTNEFKHPQIVLSKQTGCALRRKEKDARQLMAWEKGYFKVSWLPQGKSACVTSKVEQAEHSKWGLDDCFLLKCSGVQVQVTQRGLPPGNEYDLEIWLARGDKGWHRCAAAWTTLMGHNGPLQPRHLRTCGEELHQKAIISLRWYLMYCGICSLRKYQNLAFFIIKNPH